MAERWTRVKKFVSDHRLLTAALCLAAIEAVTIIFVIALYSRTARLIDDLSKEQSARTDAGRIIRKELCLRDNAGYRVARFRIRDDILEQQKFLKDHPAGIPGISADLLKRSITRQEKQRQDLAGIDCDVFAASGRIVELPVEPLIPVDRSGP